MINGHSQTCLILAFRARISLALQSCPSKRSAGKSDHVGLGLTKQESGLGNVVFGISNRGKAVKIQQGQVQKSLLHPNLLFAQIGKFLWRGVEPRRWRNKPDGS